MRTETFPDRWLERISLDVLADCTLSTLSRGSLSFTGIISAIGFDCSKSLFYCSCDCESENKIRFYYSGNPIIAQKAPWDGGFVYSTDSKGKDWVGVAVQGTGSSLWYPCKDTQSDEPDSGATIKVAVPNGLMNVSNGRFKGSEDLKNGYTRWDWEVVNTINNYDITLNIADYTHFGENYKGLESAARSAGLLQ